MQLIFRVGVSIHMNNTFTKSLLTLAVGGLMLAGSASAQTSTTSGAGPGVVDPGHPRVNEVNKREELTRHSGAAEDVKDFETVVGYLD